MAQTRRPRGLAFTACCDTADGAQKILETEWVQKAGPKTAIPGEFFKQADLWLFLIKPGNYAFTFRARNEKGWSAPAEIRFAVMAGRPYLTEQEGFQRAGSCERVVLPGMGWKQIAGPTAAAFRPAQDGVAVRPNDPGLYVFEAPRLDVGYPERRGILVPPAKDGIHGDRRPVANLPKTATGFVGRPVILDGSLSTDQDAEDIPELKARWSPADSKRDVTIEAQPGLRAVFKAARPGTYRAELVVSDGRLDSLPTSIFVNITSGEGDETNAVDGFSEGTADSDKGDRDLLLRRVSLAIWPPERDESGTLFIPDDSGLERAVQLFPKRCGVGLAVDPGIARPGHFKEFPLALEAVNAPLVHLLDGIARQTGTRYRRDADRAIWLVKPEDSFRNEKLEPAAAGIDALFEKPGAADLLAPLRDYAKPMLEGIDGTSISFEADQQALVAMLPKTASMHLREIVQLLREPIGLGLPYPEPPDKYEERIRQRLAEKTVTLRGRFRLDRLLRELARDAGLAIHFDPRLFPNSTPPYLKIDYDKTPLRQVLRDLVEDAGFDGCSIEPPAGIWFYKGARPFPSGESLWDSADVRAYDLSALLQALPPESLISGETIAHLVRSRIYPASWSDPGTLVFYHAGTRKLIVLHAPETHRKVLELLNDLRERGDWAL